MANTAFQKLLIKRGLSANLPLEATLGELHYATDTNVLYMGQGVGKALKAIEVGLESVKGLLNGEGKINSALIPELAITSVHVVADTAARDALEVQTGDVAVVIDDGDGERASYIYDGAEWVKLSDASQAVDSVNGQTGDVVLTTDNITEGLNNLYFTVQRVLDVLAAENVAYRGDNITNFTSSEAAGVLFASAGGTDTPLQPVTTIDGGTF